MSALEVEQELVWEKRLEKKLREQRIKYGRMPWYSNRQHKPLSKDKQALLVKLRDIPYNSFEKWDDGKSRTGTVDAPCAEHKDVELVGDDLPECQECAKVRLLFQRGAKCHNPGCPCNRCRRAKQILLVLTGMDYGVNG